MKKLINISQKWRKLTAFLLLLNFTVVPLLNAFPQEECNGVCEIDSATHQCSSEATEPMEMSCCDLMEMNSNSNTSTCGMEISDINCALIFHGQINPTYLIPKTIDSKIEFVQITIIDFNENNYTLELFVHIQDNSYRKKPPIFLTNSEFLI